MRKRGREIETKERKDKEDRDLDRENYSGRKGERERGGEGERGCAKDVLNTTPSSPEVGLALNPRFIELIRRGLVSYLSGKYE